VSKGKAQQADVLREKRLMKSKVRERWLKGMFSKRVTERNDHLSLHDGNSTPLMGNRDRGCSRRAFGVSLCHPFAIHSFLITMY
jgi:hypothetical protein